MAQIIAGFLLKKKKTLTRRVALLYIFANLFHVRLKRRQLGSHLCLWVQSVVTTCHVASGKLHCPLYTCESTEVSGQVTTQYYEKSTEYTYSVYCERFPEGSSDHTLRTSAHPRPSWPESERTDFFILTHQTILGCISLTIKEVA